MNPSSSATLNRRQFVARSAGALLSAAACPATGGIAERNRAKSVIFLTMSGGMSHLDTFDPKPDRPEVMGSIRAIRSAGSGMVGHHLPLTAAVMDRVCVIRSMTGPSSDHAEAAAAMRCGWPATIPRIPATGDDGECGRFRRVDLTNRRFHGSAPPPVMGHENFPQPETFEVTAEPPSIRNEYGRGRFGAACLTARRLVQRGVRAVEVELGGWDSHVDHFTAIAGRCREFDRPFAALIRDLERHGMLRDTLVVVATEFGRSPAIQTEHRHGRNHHPQAFSCLLAGAGAPGGTVIGRTDATGSEVLESPMTFADLNAAIARLGGFDRGDSA